MTMKHPLLLILGGDEFRTPELERSLQLKGWEPRWIEPAMREEGLMPSVLIVNSRRGDESIRAIRNFRSKDPLIPLVLVGENAMGFPMGVDACISHGAPPDVWLSVLKPFWPSVPEPEIPQPNAGETGEIFGKYKLVRKIASGGMADIYQAEQLEPPGFNRTLAIKRLLPQHQQAPTYTKMLLDEANLAVRLDHQNIVRIFDFGMVSDVCYIAMEYVNGGNLRRLIDTAKELGITFPGPIAAYIVLQAARALDCAHRKRGSEGHALDSVHADISPQNILVNLEGTVKLIDFGIAKEANLVAKRPQESSLYGKLLYMSPEQSLGSSIDHRSDIYSLGLVLFELLTSEQCFKADDEFGLMESVRSGAVRSIKKVKPDVSKPLARIIDKSLQKNRSNRYSSARGMAQDLGAWLKHLNLESLESDAMAFVKLLYAARPQAKAFVNSRFLPVQCDIVLPSEKTDKQLEETQGEVAKTVRPAWILPVVSLLLVLLACLLWISINA